MADLAVLSLGASEAVREQPASSRAMATLEIVPQTMEALGVEFFGAILRRYGAREMAVKERSGVV